MLVLEIIASFRPVLPDDKLEVLLNWFGLDTQVECCSTAGKKAQYADGVEYSCIAYTIIFCEL